MLTADELTSITSNLQGIWIGEIADTNIFSDIVGAVLVGRGTTVPSVRYTFLASVPFE